MNKKILIGSIIAVVILVLVSFTGVVGYQTTSTTIARASPLFSIRTQRAIGEESKDLTCDYVGKGEEIKIQLQAQNNRIELIQKVIDRISKMDDKTLNRFINFVISRFQQSSEFKDANVDEIINSFYLIINNPDALKNNLINKKDDNLPYPKTSVAGDFTICAGEDCFSLMQYYRPGCFLKNLLDFLLQIVLFSINLILFIINFKTNYIPCDYT